MPLLVGFTDADDGCHMGAMSRLGLGTDKPVGLRMVSASLGVADDYG
jgi:hypothetical protein